MGMYEEGRMASLDAFRHNMDVLFERKIQVGGSIGRAVIYDALVGDAAREFTRRGERWPLWQYTSVLRDIDPLDPDMPSEVAGCFRPEHPIDTAAFDNGRKRIRRIGDTWHVAIYPDTPHERAMTVSGELCTPWVGNTIYGIPCRTVRPAMHRALLASADMPRAKDRIAKEVLDEVMPADDTVLMHSDEYVALEALLKCA